MTTGSKAPLVTVIVPCYNEADVVGRSLVSVLRQGRADTEVVVVDDGSTDDSAIRIQSLLADRVRVVTQANRGLPAARNAGIREAKGRLVQFLDADDELLPGALDAMINTFEGTPELGMVAGGHLSVSKDGRPIELNRAWMRPKLDLNSWLVTCPVVPSAVMIDRTWLERVGGFDEEQTYVEDWDLWLRLGRARCPMQWVEQPIARHYLSGGSMSQSGRKMRDGAIRAVERALEAGVSDGTVNDLAARRARARAHLMGSCRLFASRDYEGGRKDMETAFGLDPDLADGEWPPAANWVSGWAAHASVIDPIRFLDDVVAQAGLCNDVLSKHRDVMAQRALSLRAWKALDVGELADAASWLASLAEHLPALKNDPAPIINSLIHYARRVRDGDPETFVRAAFQGLEPYRIAGWKKCPRSAVAMVRMLDALDRQRRREDGFESAVGALLSDPRLATNRGLAAVLIASLRRRTSLIGRFVRASAHVPNRPNLSIAASAFWTARWGELVFVSRGTTMLIAPGCVRVRPGATVTVGLRDTSPADHTIIEVERGGTLDFNGSVELMHGAWLRVKPEARMTIGRDTYVMSQAILWCRTRIDIGPRCAIAWRAQILDSDEHRVRQVIAPAEQPAADQATVTAKKRGYGRVGDPVRLGEHVWVGSGACILKGVTLGDGSVVAASAVVTKRVPPGALVAGSPARVVHDAVRWR